MAGVGAAKEDTGHKGAKAEMISLKWGPWSSTDSRQRHNRPKGRNNEEVALTGSEF